MGEDLLAIKMAQSKVPCLANRVKRLGSCGRQAHTEMYHYQMVWWSMQRPMKRSREHSSPSRRMPTRSIQGGKRNWVTLVNLQSKQQPLIGRKRQWHEDKLSFQVVFFFFSVQIRI